MSQTRTGFFLLALLCLQPFLTFSDGEKFTEIRQFILISFISFTLACGGCDCNVSTDHAGNLIITGCPVFISLCVTAFGSACVQIDANHCKVATIVVKALVNLKLTFSLCLCGTIIANVDDSIVALAVVKVNGVLCLQIFVIVNGVPKTFQCVPKPDGTCSCTPLIG